MCIVILCFVKVKLFVPLLCVCAILLANAIPEMTYTVLGGTLNPTHSLTPMVWGIQGKSGNVKVPGCKS